MSENLVTIGNIPIVKHVRKGTGEDRQNLVFGWANAPFPADAEPVLRTWCRS